MSWKLLRGEKKIYVSVENRFYIDSCYDFGWSMSLGYVYIYSDGNNFFGLLYFCVFIY